VLYCSCCVTVCLCLPPCGILFLGLGFF
jgi:hypothetical protein